MAGLLKAGQYLRKFREHRGLTRSEFANILGVSQEHLGMCENNKRGISEELLNIIKEKFNVDIKLLYIQNLYFKEFENEATNNHIPNNKPNNVVPIPLYNAKAAAGVGEILPDYEEKDVIYFDKRWLKNVLGINPSNLVIIHAKGDSMDGGDNPIKDDDLLMIDTSQKEGNNKIFVFTHDNELRVKKLKWDLQGNVDIISNNSKYPTEHITQGVFNNEYGRIIGRVVWNGSKENV